MEKKKIMIFPTNCEEIFYGNIYEISKSVEK